MLYESNASCLLSKRWKGGKDDRFIFATWEISFNAIEKENPQVADLLVVCGFLDNEDIWKNSYTVEWGWTGMVRNIKTTLQGLTDVMLQI